MTVERKQRAEALLIEVGVEEIPARFLAGAQRSLGERLSDALQTLRLLPPDPRPVATYSTPRRLVARVPAILVRQSDEVEEIVGPPVKVAFDPEGKPTRAAESFAERNSTPVKRLLKIETPKGLYLGVRKRVRGHFAREILAKSLPEVILGISFPKSMYWTAKTGPRFIRPIRWLLAFLAEGNNARIIPFEIAGVRSGKSTYGHRVAGSKPMPVKSFAEYGTKLRQHLVEIDRLERSKIVRTEVKALLENHGLKVVRDEDLHEWIVNSTEWPHAILGGFDKRFLHLPREILVTVMRDHQKYFAVEGKSGALQPNFVTVLNLAQDSTGLIREGHERVLTARFADAEFFWEADLRMPLEARQDMLANVTYQAEMGSYAEKVERMAAIAGNICADLQTRGTLDAAGKTQVLRAVHLCKCDLTTQMVREFTELQGIVGGLYAREQGEAAGVADAIYDHYKPANVGDDCPRNMVGAVVALADRFDSVVAGFAVGLEPTGSSDPFGLRRAGNGIVKIVIEALAGLNLTLITNRAVAYAEQVLPGLRDGTLGTRVEDFLRERIEFYFREVAGLRYDTVRAVLSPKVILESSAFVPSAALSRARKLDSIRDTDDFLALAAAAKRTRNILHKSANEKDFAGGSIDPSKLRDDAERDLNEAYVELKDRLKHLAERGDYEEAFRLMGRIRPQVDRFFDQVLVMSENAELRKNRLQLLIRLHQDVFTLLAELSEIAVESRGTSAH